jgi:hypothetical protein
MNSMAGLCSESVSALVSHRDMKQHYITHQICVLVEVIDPEDGVMVAMLFMTYELQIVVEIVDVGQTWGWRRWRCEGILRRMLSPKTYKLVSKYV